MLSRALAIRAESRDAGFGLAELVVGMALLALVSGLGTVFFVGSSTQANRGAHQALDGSDARDAMTRIADTLRLADTPTARAGDSTNRFEVITGTRVLFYANIESTSRSGSNGRSAPTLVELMLTGDRVVERTYNPTVRYATPPSVAPTPAPSSTPTPYPSPYDYTANYPYDYVGTNAAKTKPTTTRTLLQGVQLSPAPTLFTYCTSATAPSTNCTATTNPKSVAAVVVSLPVAAKDGNAAQVVTTTVSITGAVS